MDRRRCLHLTLAGGAVVVAGGSASAWWLAGLRAPVAGFAGLDAALHWLERVTREPAHRSTTAWPLAQVLEHAAQSVEGSLQGYPQLESAAFRNSIGALAFRVFTRRGRLAHDTTEPIPGAPALVATDPAAAARRLAAALQRFEATPADFPFPPHFAFGALGKDDYRRAHLMHLADHAREVVPG
jgi:hypothetical protein